MKRSITILFTLTVFYLASGQDPVAESSTYVCPPCGGHCDEEEFDQPGVCEHCNMVLIKKNQIKTVAFYLQNGVEVLDFAGPMEVFAYAGYEVFTVSKTKEPIKSQGILNVTPDYSIKDAPEADMLAFFGGGSSGPTNDPEVIDWVKSQENVKNYFSVCTGAFILAKAGILDGKVATTFHNALDGLEENFPKVDVRRNVRYVDNGNVITTAGVSAGIDGALHLVAKQQGVSAAHRTAYYMEYENWEPGEGLTLTQEDPYKPKASKQQLLEYAGTYEFEDGLSVNLKLQDSGQFIAIVDGRSRPVYYEAKDFFIDAENNPIFFKRNRGNEILGYSRTRNGELFEKIE